MSSRALPGALARTAIAAAIAAALAACTVGPDYRPPEVVVHDHWISRADTAEVDGAWWRRLRDPMLVELVDQAIVGNQDLREAGARLREARAQRDAVRGRLLPQAGVAALVTQNRLSANGQLPVTRIPGFDPEFPLHDLGFDASWEIDLWGGNRRARQGAEARVQAAEEARRGVLLQILGELVRSYVELRAAQNLRASVAVDAQAQEQVADIVADRLRVGVASELDLARARAQARSTAAALPGLEADAAGAALRIAVLVGRAPEELYERLRPAAAMPDADLSVSVGLRSDMLRRRPDVRQAERELAAATADIGVATAELFPKLTLAVGAGQQARSTGDLFEAASRRLVAGSTLRWPVYAGGRLRAQIRAADARADATLARYERVVLGALADSEAMINRFAAAGRTRAAIDAALHEAGSAVRLARQRYQAGEDDLTTLLLAQTAFGAAERQSVQARATELLGMAALYKSLGGGWESVELSP